MEVKTIILNVEEEYNIIIIEKNKGYFEYYIEKINYANLYYMFGLFEEWNNIDLNDLFNEYKKQSIIDKFWK